MRKHTPKHDLAELPNFDAFGVRGIDIDALIDAANSLQSAGLRREADAVINMIFYINSAIAEEELLHAKLSSKPQAEKRARHG